MSFLENSSSSYVNVNPMPQRYGQAYTRRAKSTIDVSVIYVSPITDMISGENALISSRFVDIDFSIDIDSQSDLIFLLLTIKENKELHSTSTV